MGSGSCRASRRRGLRRRRRRQLQVRDRGVGRGRHRAQVHHAISNTLTMKRYDFRIARLAFTPPPPACRRPAAGLRLAGRDDGLCCTNAQASAGAPFLQGRCDGHVQDEIVVPGLTGAHLDLAYSLALDELDVRHEAGFDRARPARVRLEVGRARGGDQGGARPGCSMERLPNTVLGAALSQGTQTHSQAVEACRRLFAPTDGSPPCVGISCSLNAAGAVRVQPAQGRGDGRGALTSSSWCRRTLPHGLRRLKDIAVSGFEPRGEVEAGAPWTARRRGAGAARPTCRRSCTTWSRGGQRNVRDGAVGPGVPRSAGGAGAPIESSWQFMGDLFNEPSFRPLYAETAAQEEVRQPGDRGGLGRVPADVRAGGRAVRRVGHARARRVRVELHGPGQSKRSDCTGQLGGAWPVRAPASGP